MPPSGRINSAFVKYADDGSISCKICKVTIASADVWDEHCLSKKHLKLIELLKAKSKKTQTVSKPKTQPSEERQICSAPTTQVVVEKPTEETSGVPKGVLPANFFDNQLEGMVAAGTKQKQAERELKEKELQEFNEFMQEQLKKGKQEEEDIAVSLQDGDSAYQLQTEAYKLLLENMQSADGKLPEDALKEIYGVIEECGGGGGNAISKDEMRTIVKEKKMEAKKKRKALLTPIDDFDWRH